MTVTWENVTRFVRCFMVLTANVTNVAHAVTSTEIHTLATLPISQSFENKWKKKKKHFTKNQNHINEYSFDLRSKGSSGEFSVHKLLK